MTIDPHDVEAQVRAQLHLALHAVPDSGAPWSTVQAAVQGRTQAMTRRRRKLLAVGGVVAIIATLAVTLPRASDRRAPARPKPTQTLQVLVHRSLSTITAPPIAVGAGSIFAAVWDSGELLRLDPTTLATTGRLQVGGPRNGPLSLAFGAGSLWVVNFADSSLWRVDPATMKRTQRVALGYQPSQVVVADGAVWVTECCTTTTTANRQRLVKLDPRTGATLAAVKLPGDGETGELAVGAVVAVSSENAPIQVLDPGSLTVRYTLPAGCGACPFSALAADSSALYVAGTDGVQRYAAGSAQPLATYADPAGISALTADGVTLWAASSDGMVGLDRQTLAVVARSAPLQDVAAVFSLNGTVYASVYGGVVELRGAS